MKTFTPFPILFFAFTTLALLSCKKNSIENKPPVATKPNIILILGDDVGYEIPTCDGGRSYSTPNIDNLAANGMLFTECQSSPLCSPSRFMLLTGKYNFRNYTTWGVMKSNQKTIGNMLQNAGYQTCYAGKWQLDGGDNAIHNFGFDKYSVWLPFKLCPEGAEGSRYKSAKIYENGGYLPDSLTNGKYSEDHFANYILNFIDSNKSAPFFVYYSMILCHKDFSPTPESPDYAGWDPTVGHSDAKYFPSMVEYMDKKVGLIVDKLKTLGLDNNTIIIFIGDNGTQREITSLFDSGNVRGAKGRTIEYGIHVPFICSWPGVISPGKVSNDLVDFTDFLPTLADVANTPVPHNFGILDGNSFYTALTGSDSAARSWSFCYFDANSCAQFYQLQRYSMDTAYKLYETGNFYHFTQDLNEVHPLSSATLTEDQKQVKQKLQNVLNTLHN